MVYHHPVVDSLVGKLLVAGPSLVDPNFFRTVVFICAHGEQGAFGLVINRPLMHVPADEQLAEWHAPFASPAVVFHGGPVETRMAFALGRIRGHEPGDGWTAVTDSLGLVDLGRPDAGVVTDLEAFRVFAGYAGWSAGQIEGELEEHGWFVVDADPRDPFSADPEGLWRKVLLRQGGQVAMFAYFPNDPSLN